MTPSLPVRFKAFGSRTPLAQVVRIEEGLRQAGAVEVEYGSDCDFVYANDSGTHQEAIQYRATYAPRAKLILTVLDLPEHLMSAGLGFGAQELATLRTNLLQADAITAISQYTQSQIQRLLGLSSYVIYQPVKDVSPIHRLTSNHHYSYKVLIAGRTNDPNKRVKSIGIIALLMAGFSEDEIAVVGGEYPGWGTNLGVVNDTVLNDLYNSVDYVMQTSLLEGLGLTAIEATICGAIPIVCSDLTTFPELPFPQYWGCFPSPTSVAYRLRSLQDNLDLRAGDRDYCLNNSDQLMEKFSKVTVARRVLDIYSRLTDL